MEVNSNDFAYIAGIIDGEGCITIARCKRPDIRRGFVYTLKVQVTMTDPVIPQWLHNTFGGNLYIRRSKNIKWSDAYCWSIQSTQAKSFLENLLPFLRVKDKQAKVGIAFQVHKTKLKAFKAEIDNKIDDKFKLEVSLLNKVGGKVHVQVS